LDRSPSAAKSLNHLIIQSLNPAEGKLALRTLAILGSTGSIGQNTLRVVETMPERFRVYGLTAGNNLELLAQQIARFRPQVVSIKEEKNRDHLRRRLLNNGIPLPEILSGCAGMVAVAAAAEVDTVLSATVGVAGLPATYEAVRLGRRIALANKEVMVAAGAVVTAAAAASGAEILPVDSEHNALHQCLRGGRREEVRRLILTASGGPFLNTPAEQLERVTAEQALRHPTWRMGNRITIDSATLMNKGFEVIEAHWLFGFDKDQIDVIIHPQSTVHSMVEYVDGSILAQFSVTDMRIPIQYALTYPDRVPSNSDQYLGLDSLGKLEFSLPDPQRFRCLDLAYQALEAGGAATCALNAADEVAIEAFLGGRLPFPGIARVVEETIERCAGRPAGTLEQVLECDREARQIAQRVIAGQRATG
jgi:1-deoxy-D-xylulose-5-phosphate reductoisomerase